MAGMDWCEDGDLVVGWQPQTAVCVTRHGEIEVLQGPDDGSVIALTPVAALLLAWRLIEVAHKVGLPKPPRELMVGLDMGPQAPIASDDSAGTVDTPSAHGVGEAA